MSLSGTRCRADSVRCGQTATNLVEIKNHPYYGIAGNIRALQKVYRAVTRYWHKMLCSRSRAGYLSWAGFHELLARIPLLRPRLYVPSQALQCTRRAKAS